MESPQKPTDAPPPGSPVLISLSNPSSSELKRVRIETLAQEITPLLQTLPRELRNLLHEIIKIRTSASSKPQQITALKQLITVLAGRGKFHLLPELIYHTRNIERISKLVRRIIETELAVHWREIVDDKKKVFLFPQHKDLASKELHAKKEKISQLAGNISEFEILCGIYYGVLMLHHKDLLISLPQFARALESKPPKLPSTLDIQIVKTRIPDPTFYQQLWATLPALEIHLMPSKGSVTKPVTKLEQKLEPEAEELQKKITTLLTMVKRNINLSHKEFNHALKLGCYFKGFIPLSEIVRLLRTGYANKSLIHYDSDPYKNLLPVLLTSAALCAHLYPGAGHIVFGKAYVTAADYFEDNRYQIPSHCGAEEAKIIGSPSSCNKYRNSMAQALHHFTLAMILMPNFKRITFFAYLGIDQITDTVGGIQKNRLIVIDQLTNFSLVTPKKINSIQKKAVHQAALMIASPATKAFQ